MTEWVARSPIEVFQFITDPANASKVIHSVIRAKTLTEGPVGVGTRYREPRLILFWMIYIEPIFPMKMVNMRCC